MKTKFLNLIAAIFLCTNINIESVATEQSNEHNTFSNNHVYNEPATIALTKFLSIFTSNIKDFCLIVDPIEFNFCDYNLNLTSNERKFYGFQLLVPENKKNIEIGIYWMLIEKDRFCLLFADFMEQQIRSTHKVANTEPNMDRLEHCLDLLNNPDWRYKSTLSNAIEIENAPNTFLDLHIICNNRTQEIIVLCEKGCSTDIYL